MPTRARKSEERPTAAPSVSEETSGLYGYLNELRLAEPSRAQGASRRVGKLTASGNSAPAKRRRD